jgi:uncharacterized protein YcfJ
MQVSNTFHRQSPLRTALAALLLTTTAAATRADSYSRIIEAPVVSAEPIVQIYSERVPYERCRAERVRVVDRGLGGSWTPTVLGAVVGGTVGSVLGDNSSRRDVITGAGAILGGSIGRDIGRRQQRDDGYYVTEDVCMTEYELREREEITGYRVRYRYEDRILETRTATDPGATISVRMRLEPLL